MKNNKAVISLTTWNRVEGTQKCLESIFEHTYGDYKIYITDNGSTDGTVDYLKTLGGYPIEVIYLKENIGIAQARNCHWWKCYGHDVVRMDNDIVIETDDWFNVFKEISYQHHAFVGIVPDSYRPLCGEKLNTQELIFTDELPEHEKYLYSVAGNVMFIPENAIYRLGHWCEEYGLHAFEDTDYALKAEAINYNQIFTTKVKHQHLYPETSYISKHGEELTNKNWDLVRRNLAKFKAESLGIDENDDAKINDIKQLFSTRFGTSQPTKEAT